MPGAEFVQRDFDLVADLPAAASGSMIGAGEDRAALAGQDRIPAASYAPQGFLAAPLCLSLFLYTVTWAAGDSTDTVRQAVGRLVLSELWTSTATRRFSCPEG